MENTQIRQTDMFFEITPVEGYVITDWDKKDLLDYNSTTMLIIPKDYDYSDYYTVSIEEDERLNKEIEIILKEKGAE